MEKNRKLLEENFGKNLIELRKKFSIYQEFSIANKNLVFHFRGKN